MVIDETGMKALPLRFWHLLERHPHILQLRDSVGSIHLLWMISAMLEHAPNAFSKGEELSTKSGTLCNTDVKIHPILFELLFWMVLFQENKFLLVVALIIVNYIFGTGQIFFSFSHREWITSLWHDEGGKRNVEHKTKASNNLSKMLLILWINNEVLFHIHFRASVKEKDETL